MRLALWWLGLSFYLYALASADRQAWGWRVVWWALLVLWVLAGAVQVAARAARSTILKRGGRIEETSKGKTASGP